MIDCPKSVILAGAHLVKVRHGVKSPEDAKHVGLDPADRGTMIKAFKEARQHIEAAMLDLRQFGILEMEWGPGLVHFSKAWTSYLRDDALDAWANMLCAHNCFRLVLDKYEIANPTNDQIAGVIAYGNWR